MTLANFKRPRVKNNGHLDFIRNLPCAICGDHTTTEAAHIRSGSLFYGKRNTGGGEKASDMWTLPLCHWHHTEQHDGSEAVFWRRYSINQYILALVLHACSGNQAVAEDVLMRHRRGDR